MIRSLLRPLQTPDPPNGLVADRSDTVPDNWPADLRIVRHPRARRMRLRLDRRDGAPVLTLPPGVPERRGLAFVAENLDWLAERRAARPDRIPFRDGLELSVHGRLLRIRHLPDSRQAVRINATAEGLFLDSGGEPAHLDRRITDWLKAEARRILRERAGHHAAAVGERIARVRVADQASRWGSCSSRGVLSFNWRLILAPVEVLDYVAAHEAAHLREMNHGPRFHALLASLHPDPVGASGWLDANSALLRRYGSG